MPYQWASRCAVNTLRAFDMAHEHCGKHGAGRKNAAAAATQEASDDSTDSEGECETCSASDSDAEQEDPNTSAAKQQAQDDAVVETLTSLQRPHLCPLTTDEPGKKLEATGTAKIWMKLLVHHHVWVHTLMGDGDCTAIHEIRRILLRSGLKREEAVQAEPDHGLCKNHYMINVTCVRLLALELMYAACMRRPAKLCFDCSCLCVITQHVR